MTDDKYVQQPTPIQQAAMDKLLSRLPLMPQDALAMFDALVDLEGYLSLYAGPGRVSCFKCHRIGNAGTHDHEPDCTFRLIYPGALA